MKTYHVVLVPDDGSYMVLVPSLPGCLTFGATVEDALAMAREAIALHIEGMAADGEDIPEDEGEPILATVDVEPDLSAVSTPAPQHRIQKG
ncbi:MAG TPA: type II toxin-antitoxin system HicB family antitoxin [Dehalococcoidia bacterium]|nr:type II toxin-antitoxin system HicB family antitoxin [Dehalococcoidia bacterium]